MANMSYAPDWYKPASSKGSWADGLLDYQRPSGSGPYYGPYSNSAIKKAASQGVTVSPVRPEYLQRSGTYSTYSGGSSGRSSSAPSAATVAAQNQAAAARQAQAAAEARAKAAEAKARTQANRQAKSNAQSSIDSLNETILAKRAQRLTNQTSLKALHGLAYWDLGHQRKTQLKAIDDSLATKMKAISTTFKSSKKDFLSNLRDNEKSEADSSFANLGNRARERGDLTTQALSQGAGESDVLKSQLQALRNWSANQGDVNRSFFDTRTSINAGITDLNNATRTSKINEEQSANSQRGGIWDDYYNSMSDTFTQMSNLDQQNYLLNGEIDMARKGKDEHKRILDWLKKGKNIEDYDPYDAPVKDRASTPPKYTSKYAQLAADAAAGAWKNPGVSDKTKKFVGATASKGDLNTADPSAVNGFDPASAKRKRPEGATLRKW
jgi:hypothetical protein